MAEDRIHWDCIQFEADVEKKVSHTKMLGNMSTTRRSSEVHVSDQFFIFGIPPNSTTNSEKSILVAYPPTQIPHVPIKNILQLSMPKGEVSKTTMKTTMLSNIFPLIEINGSVSSENGIIDEFVIQYNAGATKMYGICVQVQPSKANKFASNPFYSSPNTKKSQFCFCMLSKIPIINVHFTFLHYLVGLSCGSMQIQLVPPKKLSPTTGETNENKNQSNENQQGQIKSSIIMNKNSDY